MKLSYFATAAILAGGAALGATAWANQQDPGDDPVQDEQVVTDPEQEQEQEPPEPDEDEPDPQEESEAELQEEQNPEGGDPAQAVTAEEESPPDSGEAEEEEEAAAGEDADAGPADADEADDDEETDSPYPSTYEPLPSETLLIENATILDGRGGRIDGGSVLIEDGEIAAVGESIEAPDGAETIDAEGKWMTPGIIDVHSHLGVYPSPGIEATSDGNEATAPNTAQVWAEHSVWPQDPGFNTARAGGVTALQILPGSANLFGGRSVVLKNVPSRTVQGMKFPDAPYGMKMACGENPKRVYGNRNTLPSTRMGNMAGYRENWIKAQEYKRKWNEYESNGDEDADPPSRDLQMETLVGALEGDIMVHHHCYRGDEMAQIIDMSEEFGYQIATFEHAVEAYKIADLMADDDICASMWADWWGFKLEAYDGVRINIPLVHKAGACAIVHSDDALGIQRLNQEAAKALADGRNAGIDVSKAEAWQWLSYNPAKGLGIEDETGSLEAGKNADVVIWDGDPFSSYTRADKVYVDGALVYEKNGDRQAVSDFQLGYNPEMEGAE